MILINPVPGRAAKRFSQPQLSSPRAAHIHFYTRALRPLARATDPWAPACRLTTSLARSSVWLIGGPGRSGFAIRGCLSAGLAHSSVEPQTLPVIVSTGFAVHAEHLGAAVGSPDFPVA